MQFNMATDYAIRALLYLARHNPGKVSVTQIGEEMAISQNYLRHITVKLKEAGFIDTAIGRDGGCWLVRDPAEITLYDVICVIEGEPAFNRCLMPDHYCNLNATGKAVESCPVHRTYQTFQDLTRTYFSGISIGDLAEGSGALPNWVELKMHKRRPYRKSGE